MTINYLIDENVSPLYARQLRTKEPEIWVKVVGESNVPPKETLDPEILDWCEKNQFALVTNNRTSMPIHLNDRLDQNHHCPGIFILNPNLTIGENLKELILTDEGVWGSGKSHTLPVKVSVGIHGIPRLLRQRSQRYAIQSICARLFISKYI